MILRAAAVLLTALPLFAQDEYVRKANRIETIRANHQKFKLHDLSGAWHYCGPFENSNRQGHDAVFAPERGVDLKATYSGRKGANVAWKPLEKFVPGKVFDIKALLPFDDAVAYFYHETTVDTAFTLPLSLGSDDAISVSCNGVRVLHEDHERAALPDQHLVEWKLKPGKNTLLIKITQYAGQWAFYAAPEISPALPEVVAKRINRDFPSDTVAQVNKANSTVESKHYKVTTIETPPECVLEVGGLALRSDGKMYACTRRGEIWLLHNPMAESQMQWTRFTSGLHEPLGIHLENDHTLNVIQRPELTRISDSGKIGVADRFRTLCDDWGVSGGYHEYAFGPARDAEGNFFITLNVGFSAGGQSPVPWRGWCVKVTPQGKMEPWAFGVRSPNGINFSPEGDLFYTDNQGEWCATNKLCHLQRGKFYGHQAPLAWVKDSPFASQPDKVKSGMYYDGQRGPNGAEGLPAVQPPAIWFPYGRMGQSASEPRWDTTGQFGPFTGQCFVGDQTRSSVMRCALEKIDGIWQGACFPFRSGLQCGVNRLLFTPDGSLFVGQTSRGWGSVGGKPYGLQRIQFTGDVPFEIHHIAATPEGFDLVFTRPVQKESITPESIALRSYTYIYHQTYGSPEVDTKPEPFEILSVAADGLKVRLAVPGRKVGRVYDFRLGKITNRDNEPLLHAEAFYTLNAIPR